MVSLLGRRRRRPLSLPAVGMAVLLAVSSCASTRVPPFGQDVGASPQAPDERQLWADATQLEARVYGRGFAYEDAELEAYIDAVAGSLLGARPATRGLSVRVRVLRDPFRNAFALPHGTVFVHTGMLARLENEAQLATLLGHEVVHFLHRHSLKEVRETRNRRAAAAGVDMYVDYGGIQLLSKLTASGFEAVPRSQLFSDEERNRHAVDLALNALAPAPQGRE
jgi:predicted Zn-dependent protease